MSGGGARPAGTRFTEAAAAELRRAIAEAGGVEVFGVGKPDAEGRIQDIVVHCRGNAGAVPALLSRPRPGESVFHNHPSGVLVASDADMHLAGRFGEEGVGFVIVDNEVRRALWVCEPLVRERRSVPEAAVRRFFDETLPGAIPGYEARPGQVEMALEVTRALNEGGIAVLEAGTGTGKSLAYLLPSALWALENEAKVAVATFTLTLQGQLQSSDLPVLTRGGLAVRSAVIKGRSNYVCRRKLAEARVEAEADGEGADRGALRDRLRRLARWAETAAEGTRQDIAFPVEDEDWELIQSDHDQTLRARCPHFDKCFYYEARRRAADAHLLVVNHHLLLADLLVKGEGAEGILPKFDRVVIDEGHHLEDAATSLYQERLTLRAIRRALLPLVGRKGRPGALARLRERWAAAPESPLQQPERDKVWDLTEELERAAPVVAEEARGWMEQLLSDGLEPGQQSRRVVPEWRTSPGWQTFLQPTLEEVTSRLSHLAVKLSLLDEALKELSPADRGREPQPLFDLGRAMRRLGEQASLASRFQAEGPEHVRWIELARDKSATAPTAALCIAQLDVGPSLRGRVFEAMQATVATSATMTVNGEFQHFLRQVGLEPPPERPIRKGVHPSPFDYRRQALLAIPRDLPEPDAPDFEGRISELVAAAIGHAGGGVFVLCTSYALVNALHSRVGALLGDRFLLLRHGMMGRDRLLERFREDGNAVLFGTDAFWEGVSVSGAALRMVIIPRLPFRVPTEPVAQARTERLAALGQDAFRLRSLPEAVLRLRQGVGRLIRTQRDRGVVLLLDRRVSDRWYGRVFLASVPDMLRVTGPARAVLERIAAFYAPPSTPETPGW